MIRHADRTLALMEGARPTELDAELSTIGEYDFDGSTLVLRGEPCGPDVEGRYAVDFDASCSTFTFDAIDEACAGRPFDGVSLTRQ